MELAAAAALAKRLGFEGIELGGIADDGSLSLLLRNAEATKKTLDEADMRVCVLATTICLHHADEARWQRAKLLIKRAVEMAVYFGAPVVRVLGHEVRRGEGRSAVIGRIGAHLREAAEDAVEYAKESGAKQAVSIALQNGGTGGSFVNAKEMWMMTEVAGHPRAGIYWDVAEAALVKESPGLSVPTLNSRMHAVRIWDHHHGERKAVPLGEGDVKGQLFADRLRGIGYGGWVVYGPPADPANAEAEKMLETAAATLRKWIGIQDSVEAVT